MRYLRKSARLFYLVILCPFVLIYSLQVKAQENKEKKLSTIILGTHIGTSNGDVENGLGSSISLGFIKHFGENNNFVAGPYFITGAYRALAIPTDISSQTFKTSSLGIESSYNIRFIRIGTGIQCNYTRGLISESGDFNRISYGGRAYLGFVSGTKRENIQFEFRPADVLFGSGSFLQYHISFLIYFNLKND
jgi:hypothetical protein